jgi:hypothetical protein
MKTALFVSAWALATAGAWAGGYYGGDPNDTAAMTNNETGFDGPSRVYVDFEWSGGKVSELFSNNADYGGGTADGCLWEIRAGAVPGDGGVVVASSATIAGKATYTITPFTFIIIHPVFELRIDVDDFDLAPGLYHLAVVPGAGETYLMTTGGAGSIGSPINNFNDLLDYPALGRDFADIKKFAGPAYPGFSIGVVGSSSCPWDLNADGVLDLFDFLAFVNLFNAGDPAADCDQSGTLDLFDFLCFTNAFNAGC